MSLYQGRVRQLKTLPLKTSKEVIIANQQRHTRLAMVANTSSIPVIGDARIRVGCRTGRVEFESVNN